MVHETTQNFHLIFQTIIIAQLIVHWRDGDGYGRVVGGVYIL